jgi:hypothetical protein
VEALTAIPGKYLKEQRKAVSSISGGVYAIIQHTTGHFEFFIRIFSFPV